MSRLKLESAEAKLVLLGSVLLLALFASFWTDDAASQEYLNDVSRTPTSINRSGIGIEYDGFTEPKFNILVAASEMGRLETVNVKVGQRVKKGQLVAKLDDELQEQAAVGAKIRAEMRGEVEAAQAEAAVMQLRVEQLRSLADQQMARPYELKRAIADWEIAKKQVMAAQEQIQLRQHEWARYETQFQRRRVLAPMDGVVAKIFHAPGEYISPSDPAVIRLLVLDEIYAVFNVPVDEAEGITVGSAVSVHVSSLRKGLTGQVETVSPEIDGESGTVEVRVLLDNRDGKLRSGDRCQMLGVAKRNAALPTTPARRNDGGRNGLPSIGRQR
ncbi:MAG: efflux RND transporter periplasmic adaptor subunit [Planctomycetota bacterium]